MFENGCAINPRSAQHKRWVAESHSTQLQLHVTIQPLRLAEIVDIEVLAKAIWWEHHAKFVTAAQIEHMLPGKYTQVDLGPYVGATDRWFDVLRVDGVMCGFLHCVRSSLEVLKLSEVYISKSQRGTGLGKVLRASAESLARE